MRRRIHACMHVSSSSYGMPPYTTRVVHTCMYPPPHMVCLHIRVVHTCMYPPPHMACLHIRVSSSSHGMPPGPQAGGAGAPSSIYVSCVACGCRMQMPAHTPAVACPRCTMVTQAADPRAKASISPDVPSASKSRKYILN